MTRDDLLAKMRELQINGVALEHQRDGVRRMYDAAATMNNVKLADTYRQQLHDLLDSQLDNASSLALVTRTLIDSAG